MNSWGSQVGAVAITHTSHHALRPGFDPGLVRGLRFVDLNLTARVFLWVLSVDGFTHHGHMFT